MRPHPYLDPELAAAAASKRAAVPRRASWGRRALAWLIDNLVMLALLGLLAGLCALVWDASYVGWRGKLSLVGLAVLVPLLYPVPQMMRRGHRNGQSYGKQLMRIRVVADDGRPVGFRAALLREIGVKTFVYLGMGAVGVMAFVPLLGYLMPLWDRQRRAWHDVICDTEVHRA